MKQLCGLFLVNKPKQAVIEHSAHSRQSGVTTVELAQSHKVNFSLLFIKSTFDGDGEHLLHQGINTGTLIQQHHYFIGLMQEMRDRVWW